MNLRVGIGFDRHRFVSGRPFILGGVEIPFGYGLLGHSDGDCLVHSIIDSLLGAANLGDIGTLFPDTDESLRGIRSLVLLERVKDILLSRGVKVANVDSVVITDEPILREYIPTMKENISFALGIKLARVSIKGKRTEGTVPTGEDGYLDSITVSLVELEGESNARD